MDIPIPLQEALRDSITSGAFIDTTFWVFSKRGSKPGHARDPKALFMNGRVVRSVPRLGARAFVLSSRRGLLSDLFTVLDRQETKGNLRSGFPVDRKPYTAGYDYDADSDLEEDEDWYSSNVEDSQVAPAEGDRDKSDSGTLVGRENPDTKGNEPSDVVSISDVDSLFLDSIDTKTEAEVPVTPTPTHTGTVVVIDDVALVTSVYFSFSCTHFLTLCDRFQALLRYLYTNEIEFAPWGSAERRKVRAHEEIAESHETPKPSPKSIYRLADKVVMDPIVAMYWN